MGAESWAAFILALLVAFPAPGPNLVLVMQSATRGIREGLSTAAGIVSGLTIHALFAVTGATALLLSAPGILTTVQIAGAGVLLRMGASMLQSFRRHETQAAENNERLSRVGYARGFLTNVTNPKALIFFAAILP